MVRHSHNHLHSRIDPDIWERLKVALDELDYLSLFQLKTDWRTLAVESKSDLTPVTLADKKSEQHFRDTIQKHFPSDIVLGEEAGESSPIVASVGLSTPITTSTSAASSIFRWVVDPIDGTRKFMRGLPFWGICIALEINGQVELGAVAVPGARKKWWAVRGHGAFCGEKKLQVDDSISQLNQAFITMPPWKSFFEEGHLASYEKLQKLIAHDSGFLDAYSYACVADGRLHGLLSCGDKWWDIAAPSLLIQEAGGRFEKLSGGPPEEGQLNLAATPRIFDAVKKLLTD